MTVRTDTTGKVSKNCVRTPRMPSLRRIALRVALLSVPLMATGCQSLNTPKESSVTRSQSPFKDPSRTAKMEAARRHENAGELDEAKRLYTSVYQRNPSDAECCHRLGLIYSKQGQQSAADVFYQKAIDITPNNSRLLADRGFAAFLRKDYEQAEEWMEQSTKLDPHNQTSLNNSSTIRNLAIVRAWLHKDDSSLMTFRRIDSEAEALRNLGAVQIARGDKSLGLRSYELAQAIEKKGVDVPQIVQTHQESNLPPLPEVFPDQPDNQPSIVVEGPDTTESMLTEIPVDELIVPEPTNLVQAPVRSGQTVLSGPAEIVLAPLATSIDANCVLTGTCARPSISMASYPVSVITARIETDTKLPDEAADHSKWNSAESGTTAQNPETIEFELPWKRSISDETVEDLPQTPMTSNDPPESLPMDDNNVRWDEDQPIKLEQLTAERDFDEICMVTLCDERKIVKGLPEFAMDYHGQNYRFISAEARQLFKSEPERYSPAAGGLDLVMFCKEKTVIQGRLKFAVWYHRRLYLFSTEENRESFQQNPKLFLPSE